MADLAASILGIVSAGTKITLILAQLASDVGSAGKEIKMIGSEIRGSLTVLKTLAEVLKKVEESPYFAHCVEVTKDMTTASLEMFIDILDAAKDLEDMVKGKEGKDGKIGIMSRFQWAIFQRPKMVVLRAAIEAYKSNLALMLGTLSTAEKVGRRTSMTNTQKVIAEDRQDRSMLQSLQLEHQTSLIELEEAKRQFNDFADTADLLGHPSSDPIGSQYASIEERQPRDAEKWTESLAESAREEINTLRSSLSSASNFNTGVIQQQVTRYSQRLSLLMSTDQKRISQRWSTVLSPAYEAESPVPGLDSSKPLHPLNLPPILAEIRLHHSFQGDPSNVLPLDSHWPSTNTDLPTFRPNFQNEGSILPDKKRNSSNSLSDPLYLEAFNQLMKRSLEERRTIVDALLKDVCGFTKPDTNRTNQEAESFDDSEDDYEFQTLQKRRVQEYRRKLKEIKGTKQWHITRGIQQLVKEMWQANIKDPDYDPKNLLLMTFDLSHQKMKFLPELTIEILRYDLERLAVSHNSLTKLPTNFALCPYLRYLNLRANKFTDIPPTVLQLPSLEILDMGRNRLRAIPSDIWRLSSLRVLNVQNNYIQELPVALGTMSNLLMFIYDNNPILFPSKEEVRSYQCGTDLGLSEEKPDPETRQLKEYLKNHSSQISEREQAIVGPLTPNTRATASASASHPLTLHTALRPPDEVEESNDIFSSANTNHPSTISPLYGPPNVLPENQTLHSKSAELILERPKPEYLSEFARRMIQNNALAKSDYQRQKNQAWL